MSFPLSFLSRKPSSQKNNYVYRGALQGHFGKILSLGATDDGKLLASGGADGTRVWDLETMKEMRGPSSGGIMGATTAIVWIKRDDDPGECLFYGTQEGYVVRWRQRAVRIRDGVVLPELTAQQGAPDFEEFFCEQLARPAEITGLAFDSLSNRLAVCNRDGVVQIHAVDSSMNLRSLYVKQIPNSSPRAIAFGAMQGVERDVLVFNLYSGQIEIVGKWNVGAYMWVKEISIVLSKKLTACSADASIDASKSSMCLADPIYGVSVHHLEDDGLRKVKSFKVPATKKRTRVRKVSFANQFREIVSGSDHGLIYVFDRKDGHTVDVLRIDKVEWAQTVTATDCSGTPTILAAKSNCEDSEANEIYVWRKRAEKRGVAVTLLAALAFIYQNVVGGGIVQLRRSV
ncbi:WD40-repeat-containing domain protein [Mycena alexandri]|uniref:WD40-repeat-containing domain protein n=1 Tax=Mycena alexandri TaxID=1745969 RepID=A0AAD6SHX6_9AGAR|nr:WD40-repeat-containing domain protein [Mycena alexandri]